MRVISVKDILSMYKVKKKWCLAVVLAFVIMGVFFGYRSVEKKANEAKKANITSEQKVESYDKNIENLNDNLETFRNQYNAQKEYNDNSIYMKLDGNAIQTAEIQLIITADNTTKQSNLVNALSSYLKGGIFRKKVSEIVPEVSDNYLNDVSFVALSGNIFTITIYHYDQDILKKLINAYEDIISGGVESVTSLYGGYNTRVISDTVTVKSDTGMISRQSTNNNNLMSYASSVYNTETSITNAEAEKQAYISTGYVNKYTVKDWAKGIAKSIIIWAILGVGAELIWFILKNIYGKRVLTDSYFEAQNIPVIGGINRQSGEFIMDPERTGMDIRAMLTRNKTERACFEVLVDAKKNSEESINTLVEALEDVLERKDIVSVTGRTELVDTDELEAVLESGSVVLVVEYGSTLYSQIDKFMKQCDRFNIDIIGTVVVK